MKQRALSLVAALVVASLVLVAASCPPSRATYNTIDGITSAAQAAVSTFKAAKASGQIADLDGSKEAKVRAAYTKFQTVNAQAIQLARDATAQSDRDAALAVAQDALNMLSAVVEAFGVKP